MATSDNDLLPLRHARKWIDTSALISNYRQLKQHCAPAQVLAVVKCNAYGHGMYKVSKALSSAQVDGLAVATIGEALLLRQGGITNNILVMQGWLTLDELRMVEGHQLWIAISNREQLTQLEQNTNLLKDIKIWIKFDTGMNRLGFLCSEADEVIPRVLKLDQDQPVLMSHFACADNPQSPMNEQQMKRFGELVTNYPYTASMSNSSACQQLSQARYQWVRSGIALYGSRDNTHRQKQAPGETPCLEQMKPVMHLYAPIMAIRQCAQGDCIGYGASYTCPKDMTIGIVAIGYGDGYPWNVSPSTPVWVAGKIQTILGRVSMDLIAISLEGVEVRVGDVVELWGTHIAVEEIAAHCNTIGYELLTRVSHVQELDHSLV